MKILKIVNSRVAATVMFGLSAVLGCSFTDTSYLGSGTSAAAGSSASAGSAGASGGIGGTGGAAAAAGGVDAGGAGGVAGTGGVAGGAGGTGGVAGLAALGVQCTIDADCTSDHCVDGVCCDVACAGSCEACTALKKGAGLDGECGPVEAGGDPDTECADHGAASCGQDGSCDGAGACRTYLDATPCGSLCSGQVLNLSTCQGGSCQSAGAEDCEPYACAGVACKTSCSSNPDCASGRVCVNNACVPPLVQGAACGTGGQCETGFCVDGVCCNSACTEACKTCAGDASPAGTCGNVRCGPVGVECSLVSRCVEGGCGLTCL